MGLELVRGKCYWRILRATLSTVNTQYRAAKGHVNLSVWKLHKVNQEKKLKVSCGVLGFISDQIMYMSKSILFCQIKSPEEKSLHVCIFLTFHRCWGTALLQWCQDWQRNKKAMQHFYWAEVAREPEPKCSSHFQELGEEFGTYLCLLPVLEVPDHSTVILHSS